MQCTYVTAVECWYLRWLSDVNSHTSNETPSYTIDLILTQTSLFQPKSPSRSSVSSLISDETLLPPTSSSSSVSSSPTLPKSHGIIRHRAGSPPPSSSLASSVSSLSSSRGIVSPLVSRRVCYTTLSLLSEGENLPLTDDEGHLSSGSASQSSAKKKRLHFGNVEVRTMNREPGEGVPREGGAPLGLGWNVVEQRVLPLNSFEEERTKRRVPK